MGRFTIPFPSSSAYANQRHELLSIAGEVCLDALFHALVPRWGNHEQEKVHKNGKTRCGKHDAVPMAYPKRKLSLSALALRIVNTNEVGKASSSNTLVCSS